MYLFGCLCVCVCVCVCVSHNVLVVKKPTQGTLGMTDSQTEASSLPTILFLWLLVFIVHPLSALTYTPLASGDGKKYEGANCFLQFHVSLLSCVCVCVCV